MAGAPDWKIYRNGEYIAACKHPEDAAALVSAAGGDVRYGHSKADIVWREGSEEFSAGESYDRAAEVMQQRLDAMRAAARERMEANQRRYAEKRAAAGLPA